jgi:hypothetical protein
MALSASESEVSLLSSEEVKQTVDPGAPIFFADVRRHPDDLQVKGARYYDPEVILAVDPVKLLAWKDQLIITYCT